ncbi:hypothetical protein BJY16_003551 [Actinoplanes octamycinicus]|uniref:Secreted protein n=1 Tax=Actinoplanes octamycinicus TaxID=135948 RepID=A0A7W7GXT3_9ACTN|nr:hypothetical protein [Actinoplanes octamycinicus]MBB4740092.1 hypothetical protein [Actinoplanes octamycinicus]GIE59488.1 hypothetical protein Aoc01nite_48900 [Actinoplanes octamycinicus]
MRTFAACTTLVVVALLGGACTGPAADPAPPPAASAAPVAAAAVSSADCNAGISTDALPVWARDGFNFDGSGVPHRLGDQGGLMAILFAPPRADPVDGTKILWVSKLPVETAAPLTISGVRLDGLTATQELPNGAGPSSVKIPEPGCWDLTLTWSGHTDRMRLWFTV